MIRACAPTLPNSEKDPEQRDLEHESNSWVFPRIIAQDAVLVPMPGKFIREMYGTKILNVNFFQTACSLCWRVAYMERQI